MVIFQSTINSIKVAQYVPKYSYKITRYKNKQDQLKRPKNEDDQQLLVDVDVVNIRHLILLHLHHGVPLSLEELKHHFLKFTCV